MKPLLASIFRRRRLDGEISRELEDHLQRRVAALVASGLDARSARRRAHAEFGSLQHYREETREAYGAIWLESAAQDLRLALRSWLKSPGLAALVVLVLALSLGACAAVFTLVNSTLLASWPFPAPQQIQFLARLPPPTLNLGYQMGPWGRVDYLNFAAHTQAFQSVAALEPFAFTLTGWGEPVQIRGYGVTSSFFQVLGERPQLGRWFNTDKDHPGAPGVVVISDEFWRSQLHADPRVIGTTLDLSGRPYAIVGVMPAGFDFPRSSFMPGSFDAPAVPGVWVPLALPPGGPIRNEPSELAVLGRLRPGFTLAQGQADLDLFAHRMDLAYPRARGFFRTRAVPLTVQASGPVRRPLLLLLSVVALVLLLACINVAGLLLARGLARGDEFAVRLALGAHRRRLARQLTLEVLPLALLGGGLGLALAQIALRLVKRFGPSSLSVATGSILDGHVVWFALLVTLGAALLCALPPALQAARRTAGLRAGARELPATSNSRARRALLTAQVALAVIVVIGAGLLLRSFRALLQADTGIRPAHVLTFTVPLPVRYAAAGQAERFYRDALARLRALPGVSAAGVTETLPVDGATEGTSIRLPGRVLPPGAHPIVNYTFVSPGYLRAIGATILHGRGFNSGDNATSPAVVIISSAMARQFWPAGNALGQRVGPASHTYPAGTIVGVVADIKHLSLAENPAPEMYVLYDQHPWPSLLAPQFAVRTRGGTAALAAAARKAIHVLDPGLAVAGVAPLASLVHSASTGPRFTLWTMSGFALFALLLAALGIYGVVALEARQRMREFGLRLALGASPRAVLSSVAAHAAGPAALGVILGLAAAWLASQGLRGVLYGTAPDDPLTFAAVAALLSAVALIACWLPARRAARLDPRQLLRGD